MVSQKTYLSIVLLVCPIAVQSAAVVVAATEESHNSNKLVRDLFYPAPKDYTKRLSALASLIDEKAKTEKRSYDAVAKSAIIAFLNLEDEEAFLLSSQADVKDSFNPLFRFEIECKIKEFRTDYTNKLATHYDSKKAPRKNLKKYYARHTGKELATEDFTKLPLFSLNPLLAHNLSNYLNRSKTKKSYDSVKDFIAKKRDHNKRSFWVPFDQEQNQVPEVETQPLVSNETTPLLEHKAPEASQSLLSSIPLLGRLF